MKKSLFAIPFILMGTLTLASCHHVILHNAFEVPETFDETKEYNIEFWAKNDSDARQIEVYQNAITEFNKYYPNIHVDLRNFTSYPDIHREVLLNMSTDSTPNVCITYPDNVATYLESSNSVVALTYLMEDKNYGLSGKNVKFETVGEDGIVESFKEEGKIDGEYYTIPYMRSTEALYINKTYVERLGFEIPDVPTWDWLWEVCERAVEEKEAGNEVTTLTDASKDFKPLIYKSSDNWFIQYAKQAGMDYTKDGKAILFNDKNADYLYDLKQKFVNDLFEVFSVSSHYPGDLINVWDAIFGIDSTAGATWIGWDSLQGTSSLGYEEFETEIRCVPQVDAKNPKMISQGPSICVFNKEDSGEVLASWLFAQFLLTDDIQFAYQKTEGYLPVTNRVLDSEEFRDYLNGDEIYSGCKKVKELLLNNLDNTFITEVFNGSADVRTAAGALINGIAGSKTAFQTKEAIVEKLYPRVIKNCSLTDLVTDSEEEATTKSGIGAEGIILLVGILVVWCGIGAYVAYDKGKVYIKKRKAS